MEKKRNLEIANIFYKIADILELKKVKWKPAAYRMAAQTLESLEKDVTEIYKEKGEIGIDSLPGIGSGITKKIIQYLKTNKIEEFEKLKKTLPSGLYELMNIHGVGAKKASLFYHKLGIKNVSELKNAAEKHKLIGLPGFKEKAEENVLEGISLMKSQEEGRISLAKAQQISNIIINEIKKLPEVEKVVAAGSLRRKKPTVGDLDIVIETANPKKVAEEFANMHFVKMVLNKGKEKATVITKENIQVDIRLFSKNNFGSGLLYFTGDKQHNIWLRKIAIKKGFKLNEYGLFNKQGKQIAGKTEREIYNKLGIKFIPPKKRVGEMLQN